MIAFVNSHSSFCPWLLSVLMTNPVWDVLCLPTQSHTILNKVKQARNLETYAGVNSAFLTTLGDLACGLSTTDIEQLNADAVEWIGFVISDT